MRLWTRSHAQLRRLEEEELAADAKQGWADVEAAPFLAPGAGAAAAEEEEEEAPVTPCASDSDSDDEGKAVLARARAQVARQKAEARRAEEAAAQRRKQQEDVDGFAAELARLLPQQTQQEEGALGAAAQQQAADTAWRKPAQELLRQAGELPRRQAPPPGSQGSDVKLGEAEVRAMVARATLPGLAAMAPVLRAIGGATEVRGPSAGVHLACAVAWLVCWRPYALWHTRCTCCALPAAGGGQGAVWRPGPLLPRAHRLALAPLRDQQ